ncbi:MAG: hypothetical protein Kow0098_10770 [Ignavibacteriaceae bacterium]
MQFILPDNIFTKILSSVLDNGLKKKLQFSEASLIAEKLKSTQESIALLPVTDLINNRDLFVSSKIGISFEGNLANSYIYFSGSGDKITDVSLCGDVSSVEVLLTKILFKELFNISPEITLSADRSQLKNKNHIVVGNQNFTDGYYKNGVSFAEEIVEVLQLPFVNYILVSDSSELLKSANLLFEKTDDLIYDYVKEEKFSSGYSSELDLFIADNIGSVIYNLDSQDIEGIRQILSLPFYYGMIEDLFEVKFID